MITEIHIAGTHCKACKMLIEEVGGEQPGVSAVTVDFATGKTVVEHGPSFDWQGFKREIEALGSYEVHLAPADARQG